MNYDNFKSSVSSGRLPLTIGEKFTHYFIVITFTGFSLMGVYSMIIAKDVVFFERSCYGSVICMLIALMFYFTQRRRLRFIVIDTILDKKQFAEVIDYVASKRNWEKRTQSLNYYYTATSYGGFLRGSWGEMITILYHDHKIYFNSICDPNKKSSVTAWGRNRKHADMFIKAVKLLEEDVIKRTENKTAS